MGWVPEAMGNELQEDPAWSAGAMQRSSLMEVTDHEPNMQFSDLTSFCRGTKLSLAKVWSAASQCNNSDFEGRIGIPSTGKMERNR